MISVGKAGGSSQVNSHSHRVDDYNHTGNMKIAVSQIRDPVDTCLLCLGETTVVQLGAREVLTNYPG